MTAAESHLPWDSGHRSPLSGQSWEIYVCKYTRVRAHALRLAETPTWPWGILWTWAQAEHAVTQDDPQGLCPKDIL